MGRKKLNEIVIYEDYAEILLYDKNGNEKARAMIDIEDIDRVKDIKWYLDNSNGYVRNSKIGYLHRLIMNTPKDLVVDHINHNKLNNRKSNLRICSQSENIMNVKVRTNSSSGVTGVIWNKQKNKWSAEIMVDYKKIFLGYFDTKEEAIKVRKQAELEYFGEYRYKGDE